jgi:hypothetical protein
MKILVIKNMQAICNSCGGSYSVEAPRVLKQSETADLCWVCARLYHSAVREAKAEGLGDYKLL